MPYPEAYSTAIFAAIVLLFAAVSSSSVGFYNTLYKKDLLSDKEPSRRAKNPLLFLCFAAVGAGIGVLAAMKDLTADGVFLLVMLPAAACICVCDILNGFVPLFCVILSWIILILRLVYDCFLSGNLVPAVTFVAGALVCALILAAEVMIAKKTGGLHADFRTGLCIALVLAGCGITIGAAVLFTSVLLAFLTFVLPVWLFERKKSGIRLTSVGYPLMPYLFTLFYATFFIFGSS